MKRLFSSYTDAVEFYAGEGLSAEEAKRYAGSCVCPQNEPDEESNDKPQEHESEP